MRIQDWSRRCVRRRRTCRAKLATPGGRRSRQRVWQEACTKRSSRTRLRAPDGCNRFSLHTMKADDINTYEISRLLYSLREPANREAFRAGAEAYCRRFAPGARGMRLLL